MCIADSEPEPIEDAMDPQRKSNRDRATGFKQGILRSLSFRLEGSLEEPETRSSLSRLKKLTIAIPVAFLFLLHYMMHGVLNVLHDFPGNLVLLAVVALGIVFFSLGVFRIISFLERQILEQNKRLATVNEIAAASAENLELEELLDVALDRVLEVMHAEAGVIYVNDAEDEELSTIRYRGFSEQLAQLIRSQAADAASKRQKGSDSKLRDAAEDLLQSPRIAELAQVEDFKHGAGVTLVANDEINAFLGVATSQKSGYSQRELRLLTSIGAQLGLAVRNATLFSRTKQRNRELAALLTVGRAVTASLKLSEVLARALNTVLDVTTADVAEVWLTTENEELVLERQQGHAPDVFKERNRLRKGEGLPGLVVESGSPLVVRDLSTDPRFARLGVQELGYETYYALPLRHRGMILGVLGVIAHDPEALSKESEQSLLEGIGEQLAVAIENSRLHVRVLDAAVIEERERIARDLHDGMAQVLGYINTQALAVRKLLESGRAEEAEHEVRAMEKEARRVYTDIREEILVLRTSLDSRGGLIAGLRGYLREYGQMAGTTLEMDVSEKAEAIALPASTEIQLMRIVQEAISNVRKHAQANKVTVNLDVEDELLTVRVEDDGQGYEQQPVNTDGPRFGLRTMRERAESIGGEFEVMSSLGSGTTVVVRAPIVKKHKSREVEEPHESTARR